MLSTLLAGRNTAASRPIKRPSRGNLALVAVILLVTAGASSLSAQGFAPIVLVQHASHDAGTTTSSTLAFKSNNTAGNWIGVCVRAGAENETITVTDSRGNSYHKAVQFNETGDGNTVAIFYAENISGGANTIHVSDTGSASLRFVILEYEGVATSGSLDLTATGQGKSTAPKTGSVVPAESGELALGVIMTGSAEAFTAGAGYKVEELAPAAPNAKLVVEDQIQASAGAIAVSATVRTTDNWAAGLATFRPATRSGIALVQHTSLDAGTTTASALSFKSANSAGNWIGVCVRAGAAAETITVTDSNHNTYRKAFLFNETVRGNTIAIYYAENIAGGTNTVHVSDSHSATLRFAILEYAGVASANSLDLTAAGEGNTTTPKSGTVVTAASGDLALGIIMTADVDSYSAGAGFKVEEIVPAAPNARLLVEDQIQSGAGTAAASATLGKADNWAAGLATFKPATRGSGTASAGNLTATPGSAVFSSVPVGTTYTQSIQLKNPGTASGTISKVSVQGTGFGITGLTTPLTLAANGTATFNVTYSPRSSGTVAGILTLSVSGSGSPLTIPLVGSAMSATRFLSATPTTVNFGKVAVGGYTTANVMLVNTGNSSITVQGLGSTSSAFSAIGASAGTVIAPGQAAVLSIQFSPKSTVTSSGSITIASNAGNASTLSIPVSGTGVTQTSGNYLVQLDWGPSPSASVVGYNIYRSTLASGPYTKIVSAPVSGTTYSDQTVEGGIEYFYVVTSVAASGAESAPSNQSIAYIP